MSKSMPLPRHDSDFPGWLVPARSNIQQELLRIKNLLAEPPLTADPVQRRCDEDQLNLMLGAAYSLWKAVVQSGHRVDHGTVMKAARDFVDDIVRNDAALNNADTSAWSLGFYLSDARLRLLQAVELWRPTHPGIASHVSQPLGSNFFARYRAITKGPVQPTFTPSGWGHCFGILSQLLSFHESRARLARDQTAATFDISSTAPAADTHELTLDIVAGGNKPLGKL
jgi:hypothetical protein